MPDDQLHDRMSADEHVFRLLVSHLTDCAMFVVDRHGLVKGWNSGAEHLFGYVEREIVGKSMDRFFTPEDLEAGVPQQEMREALQAGVGPDDRWHVRKDGSRFWGSGLLTPVRDAAGEVCGFAKIVRDRTSWKRQQDAAEAVRRRQEARTAAILDTALDCIITIDAHGSVLEFNPAAERTFGYRRADVLGRELSTLIIPPPLRAAHRRGLAHYLATGEGPVLGKRIELSAMRADRTEFPVELAITRIVAEGPPMFTAYLREISDRVWAAQLSSARLAVTQHLAQAVDLEAAAVAVLEAICENLQWDVGAFWVVGADDQALTCVATWHTPGTPGATFAGASGSRRFVRGEGLPGRVWATGESAWLLDVRSAANFPRAAAAAAAGLRSACAFPVVVRGVTRSVMEFFTPRSRASDASLLETMATVAGHVGQFLDRLHAEHTLRESEENLRLLADTIPQLAWMARPDGHIFWYNRRWYEYTGTRPEEMEGWGWQSVHDPAVLPDVLTRWRASIDRGVPFDMVFPIKGADAQFRPFLTRVNPLRDEAGRIIYWFGTNTDVSDIKRMEQALRDADLRKDEFLATLAHELRNPLAPIRNSLQILKMPRVDAATAAQTRDMMERQVDHLVRLVDDLMDVSRVVRGKIELRRAPVELTSIIARAVETAQPLLDTYEHRLEISTADESLLVDADAVRLTQVVSNLLINAAKYTEAGGQVDVSAAREGDQVVLRVRDNGIGIALDVLPHVFDLFVQGQPAATRAQGGLGVGLTLVKNLVNMHGGTVEATSAGPGAGAEFTVRLPLITQVGEERPGPGDTPPVSVTSHRILIVDDNADAADSLAVLLQLQGHEVTVAHDGLAALDTARACRPALILLDIGMPDMDGYEVARRLRGMAGLEHTVLAALTGWGQQEDRRRSRAAGFDHHLIKPLEPQVLQDLLAGLPPASRTTGRSGPTA